MDGSGLSMSVLNGVLTGKVDENQKEVAGKDEKTVEVMGHKYPMITDDLYDQKEPEFRHWLKNVKHRHLKQMKTAKARKLFKKFVQSWNAGQLEERCYVGIAELQIQE